MSRHKDGNWQIPDTPLTWEQAQVAVLMDLRDELKALRQAVFPLRHLSCSNFLAIPQKLDRIAANTRKRRRQPRKQAA